MACVADVIVTNNLSDFPAAALAPFGIVAVAPDDFVCDSLDVGFLAAVAATHRRELRRPPLSPDEYRDALRRNGLPRTADALSDTNI
ncbi:MAG: hypothetical protein U0746_21865 [Gemmataceae bacterium]